MSNKIIDVELISYIREKMHVGSGKSINSLGKLDIPTVIMLMEGYASHKVNEYDYRKNDKSTPKDT